MPAVLHKRDLVAIVGIAVACLPGTVRAVERVDYLRSVKPILAARCFACHGALQQKGGLRLDTVALMKKGGETGPAIVSGKSAASRLINHVTASNGARRMPPSSEGDGLKPAEIALLRAWLDQGAAGPADEKPEVDPREHWAFKRPVRPAVPVEKGSAWARNPIDQFLAAEYPKHGLTPHREVDRRLLLRRVYLDLIGLPPTLDEQAAFLADRSPDAYEKVVDRLLDSKHYGERWGRHWMDVWRYSDWWGLGAEVRNSQKHIWHWRDWIIESLNADKGYDQMLREMLAADELYPTDADRLRATGFLARSYFKFNHNTWLEEVVEHTSKAFLGLTMNCTKCHDHKYDPISQQDFYRFRAFFEPYQVRTDMVPGETDFEKDGIPRAFDCNLDAATYLFVRGDERQPKKSKPLAPGLPAFLLFGRLDIRPVSLPAEAHLPGMRAIVRENYLHLAERQIASARLAVDQASKTLSSMKDSGKKPIAKTPGVPGAVTTARPLTIEDARLAVVVAEKALTVAELQPALYKAVSAADRARHAQPPAANSRELARLAALAERRIATAKAEEAFARAEREAAAGIDRTKAETLKKLTAARNALAAAKKALNAPGETYTSLRGSLKTVENNLESEASRNRPFPATSSGRRSALAAWMTRSDNPLTARVAVNHIWARHFGKPLVPTVFDLGRKGQPPTHPELLDWLAVEFVESHWSIKHLHRLMVTSSAYRMASASAGMEANRTIDAGNRWYWRMNSVRMEAEVLRDNLLYLAGELDARTGGPSIPAGDESSRRKSLYFVHSHNDHHRFLSVFDDASVLECYRRAESIVPQQALALQNSQLAVGAAEKIAARLGSAPVASDEAFIRSAFETILAVSPTAQEQAECQAALSELFALAVREKRPNPEGRARATLVGALLNHNDFVTIR